MRDIPDFPGYRASAAGRVWSDKRGRYLTPNSGKDGYLRVGLRQEGRTRTVYVHRLVALAYLGPCPEGQEVRHLNGCPADNRVENLAYGTHLENMADMRAHGGNAQARRTHCAQGHPYIGDNLHVRPRNGKRECRQCMRDRAQAYRTLRRMTVCPNCQGKGCQYCDVRRDTDR